MGIDFKYLAGQTPIGEDDQEGLLIPTISTRGELDEFEQQNIEQAVQWTLSHRFRQRDILSERFIRELHKRMFGEVWLWAGEFRKSNTNIGVDKWQIGVELRNLLGDADCWIANKVYCPDDIAIRFKHRLVSIHCFPNGNGRHSRLMADIIVEQVFKRPQFTWGTGDLSSDVNTRKAYLDAVKAADQGDFNRLSAFARS